MFCLYRKTFNLDLKTGFKVKEWPTYCTQMAYGFGTADVLLALWQLCSWVTWNNAGIKSSM